MSEHLAHLICGRHAPGSDLASILEHVSQSLRVLGGGILGLKNSPPETLAFYGPWLGRSILEVAFSGIIARVDPFRILALKQIQKHKDFEIGARNSCSIQWQGDVMAAEVLQDPWSPKNKFDKISRAILADPSSQLHWAPAFTRLMDLDTGNKGGDWMANLSKMDEGSFISRVRSEMQNNYSSLSKGVHHEFVLPPASLYDESTVKSLINSALENICHLGLASHLIIPVAFPLDVDAAITAYENIQGELQL